MGMTTSWLVRKPTFIELAIAITLAAALITAKAVLPRESSLWPHVYSGFFLVSAGLGIYTFVIGIRHLRRKQYALGLVATGCGAVIIHGSFILAAYFLWPHKVVPWLSAI